MSGARSGRATSDGWLDRIERRALVIAIVAAGLAWMIPGGGAAMAAAVAGGAILAFTSYWTIKRSVTRLADAAVARANVPDPEGSRLRREEGSGLHSGTTTPRLGTRGALLIVLRYALLAGMAYVMIARLRLPPVGLLCGVSVTMLAATAELVWRRR
ncbi:MAG TPA: hypothetical protein VHD57_15900 [Vicinamibacterales bacterium]|nr:hypothetical protein [Vicinamibacterales bacterium]